MRWLFVRPSPQLRVRCAIAASQQDVPSYKYCRKIIEGWLRDDAKPALQSAPDEQGAFHAYRYPVTDDTHRVARMIACDWDISLSTLVIRILHAYVPFEVEVLAAVIGASPLGSSALGVSALQGVNPLPEASLTDPAKAPKAADSTPRRRRREEHHNGPR